MMDHSENTLRAAIKCLRDTVSPAVDPDDAQAVEQLRLTVDFLEFLRTRLYDIHARQRYELRRQLDVAHALLDDARALPGPAGQRLTDALDRASAVHGSPDSHTNDLREASLELWSVVRGVVRSARSQDTTTRQRVSATVLSGMEPLVELESAWYLPFGFEPDPGSIPALGDLLESDLQSFP